MTSRHARTGFSLLELMIAIVILGIGLVMVATVFPVGLDIARETLQMNISQAVVDSAIGTLQLRVPVTPVGALPGYECVLVPDVLSTDADTELDEKDAEVLEALLENAFSEQVFPACPQSPAHEGEPPNNGRPWLWDTMGVVLDGMKNDLSSFFLRTRVFTERSGWDGQLNNWNSAFVVPYQNLPPAWASVNEIPTILPPTFGVRSYLPRVHLADQVYPPVALQYEASEGGGLPGRYIVVETGEIADLSNGEHQRLDRAVAEVAAQRRYGWIAVHHRVSGEDDEQAMMVTVMVTHRADLNAYFLGQRDESSGGGLSYNLDDGADVEALLLPSPDLGTATLFPQAWLVMFNEVDLSAGLVRCTHHVASLLPGDSYFVVARTAGNLYAGTTHQVLERTFDPGMLGAEDADEPGATLRVSRGSGTFKNVPVWVVPPAYDVATGVFRVQSPVAGVALREVGM